METSLKKSKFFIHIKIISTESHKEKTFPYSKFTQYRIKIFTNDKTWELNKRYSNFNELHKKLSKKFSNLPKLPPKKIFQTETVIRERQEKLEKYLNILLNREDIYKFDEIFEFIEMEKEYYLMLKRNIEEESTFDTFDNSFFSTAISDKVKSFIKNNLKKSRSMDVIIKENFFYSECNLNKNFEDSIDQTIFTKEKNFEINNNDRKYSIQLPNSNFNHNQNICLNKIVSSFLRDLNKKIQNRCEIIKNFENNFYQENSKFSFNSEHAYRILFGELTTDKNVSRNERFMFGLIHHTGTIEENLLGAEACLEFISKLIDCQYNFNSDIFALFLKSANASEILQMKLERHLKIKRMIHSCYKILEVLCDVENGIKLDYLIKDEELRESYYNWLVNRY